MLVQQRVSLVIGVALHLQAQVGVLPKYPHQGIQASRYGGQERRLPLGEV
nr:hypothetical protein [Hymenobacter coccineus]